MKNHTCLIGLMICLLSGFGSPSFAIGSELVDLLVKNIGVTTEQAKGGAGAVFKASKQNMDAYDFSKVKAAMPEVESLMAFAPKIDKISGALGGFSSMLGKNAESASKTAGLYGAFSKLGLSKEMVGKFIPLILNYAKTKGGTAVSDLLKTALR